MFKLISFSTKTKIQNNFSDLLQQLYKEIEFDTEFNPIIKFPETLSKDTPLVICFHGLTSNPNQYEAFIKSNSTEIFISLALPGHYNSKPETLRQFSQDNTYFTEHITTFIKNTKQPTHVIGTSAGAMYARTISEKTETVSCQLISPFIELNSPWHTFLLNSLVRLKKNPFFWKLIKHYPPIELKSVQKKPGIDKIPIETLVSCYEASHKIHTSLQTKPTTVYFTANDYIINPDAIRQHYPNAISLKTKKEHALINSPNKHTTHTLFKMLQKGLRKLPK